MGRNGGFVRLVLCGSLIAGVLGCGAPIDYVAPEVPPPPGLRLDVSTELDGLDQPWDVVAAPDGSIVVGEKSGTFVLKRADGSRRTVESIIPGLRVSGETGMMGLALAQDFESSRKMFVCHGFQDSATTDVRISEVRISQNWDDVNYVGPIITGFPATSGRHGGCRILAHPDGSLYVGTGDAATGTNPQNPESLGGKVLRITTSGEPAVGNPTSQSPVYTRGHRNVQGLALQAGTGRIYSVEHGPTRDDEINLLVRGGNYGWRPDRSGYDDSSPMTDKDRVPEAVDAVWSSGAPTLATSGAAFTAGESWGEWQGALAVAALKGQQLLLVKLSEDGASVSATAVPDELEGTHGRLRSVTSLADGSLLITTDESPGQVLRVRAVPAPVR